MRSEKALFSNTPVENEKSETVQRYTCLGGKITYNGKSETDIKSRIAQAKQVFYKKKNLFTTNTGWSKDQKNSNKEFCTEYSATIWGRNTDDRTRAFETRCWKSNTEKSSGRESQKRRSILKNERTENNQGKEENMDRTRNEKQ